MAIISLKGLEFFAYHGVHDFEKEQGNSFVVDVDVEVDVREAEESDELDGTVDYEELFKIIAAEMAIRSKLLEHVSSRICHAVLNRWENVTRVKIQLGKLKPPIGAVCKMSVVTLEKKR
ncbi:MAG: dihydroneopterin aldolase [Cyclobacteriaceae bacterium]|nr:dihydroneopterin aldolase [Cyclobacteriaceae bacterium]